MKTAEMIPFTAETVAVQRPSFWKIADDLEAYHETIVLLDAQIQTCADAQERELLWEEHREVGQRIERLSEALVKKTDDLAGVMRRMKHDVSALKDEETRLRGRRAATEAALDSLKGYTRSTMDKHGWRHLKTAQNTIAIRGNGGVQPLVVDDPSKVPPEFRTWSGTFTSYQVSDLYHGLRDAGWEPGQLDSLMAQFTSAPSNALIREALCQPCVTCDGAGAVKNVARDEKGSPSAEGDPFPCPVCGGSGRESVPGAHLEERGSHLELR